jgi:P4 family phage/plasmid primase-like protien
MQPQHLKNEISEKNIPSQSYSLTNAQFQQESVISPKKRNKPSKNSRGFMSEKNPLSVTSWQLPKVTRKSFAKEIDRSEIDPRRICLKPDQRSDFKEVLSQCSYTAMVYGLYTSPSPSDVINMSSILAQSYIINKESSPTLSLEGVDIIQPEMLLSDWLDRLQNEEESYRLPESRPQFPQFPSRPKCIEISQNPSFFFCRTCPHLQNSLGNEGFSPLDLGHSEKYYETKKISKFMILRENKDGELVQSKEVDHKGFADWFNWQYEYKIAGPLNYRYAETHWKQFSREQVAELFLRGCPSSKSRDETEVMRYITRRNLCDIDWFQDKSKNKINLLNGIYDISKMEMLPHSPKYGFRYCLPYNFDEKATCPRFDEGLKVTLKGDEELESLLFEYIGYILSGCELTDEKALFLDGSGRNGKTTIINIMKKILGADNYGSMPLTKLDDPVMLLDLEGKLVNWVNETPSDMFIQPKLSTLFKELTSTQAELTARKLYHGSYKFKSNTKLIFLTNELPKSSDKSYGLSRRMAIIPFTHVFSDDDEDTSFYDYIVENELPGIFNKCLEGYKRVLDRKGKLIEPNASKLAKLDYQKSNDSIFLYLDET